MSKPNRGSNARKINGWRGTCPVCKRKAVKILWTKLNEKGEQIKVCKKCGK